MILVWRHCGAICNNISQYENHNLSKITLTLNYFSFLICMHIFSKPMPSNSWTFRNYWPSLGISITFYWLSRIHFGDIFRSLLFVFAYLAFPGQKSDKFEFEMTSLFSKYGKAWTNLYCFWAVFFLTWKKKVLFTDFSLQLILLLILGLVFAWPLFPRAGD